MLRFCSAWLLFAVLLAACSAPVLPQPSAAPVSVPAENKASPILPPASAPSAVAQPAYTAQPSETPIYPATPTASPTSTITPTPTSTSTVGVIVTPTRPPSATATAAPASGYSFERVFIIVLENHGADAALANPYFKALAARGAYLSNYHGVGHPSEPNYLALIAGATFVTDDGDYNLPQSNLVDLLEGAGRSWKSYQENYPGACFTGSFAGDPASGFYARKHNPFISFDSIRTDPARCAKIVKAEQLSADIAADKLPDYSFYVPNQNNDGHDRPLTFAAQWFQGFIEPKLADPRFMRGTLIVVTFDETDSDSGGANGNHVYTLLLGAGVKAGSVDGARYDHYSLLRTVEEAFTLGTLGRADAAARPFAACNFGGGCEK